MGNRCWIVTWLRRRHNAPVYMGIEVEIHEQLAVNQTEQSSLASLLAQSLFFL